MLKRLYNLYDEQMEYQILDRMSYQRFCGLSQAKQL
jgi:IS5 family transposase